MIIIPAAEVANREGLRDHRFCMTNLPRDGRQLITLAQQLARDAERHAILSASLASQADRLMVAGLKKLQKTSNQPQAASSQTPR